MKETVILEKLKEKKLKNPILITGLPGIGLIGQVVGRYLVEELKAPKLASLISPHFPHQVFMTKKGKIRLIKNSFFLFKGKKRDVIILVGDVQAINSVGQYEVAGKMLDYLQKWGVTEILTVGGYSTGKISDNRRIFAVTTSEQLRAKFEKMGVIFGEAKGSIVGAAGLLPALGSLRGIPGSCIMGETHGGYVDSVSARGIVQLLAKYLDLTINLKRLDEKAEESKKVIKKVEADLKKSIETQYDSSAKGATSYIR
ncbi:proteasome assembly chaperone family protein [Candidatus Micrarchaeota archaeon]|nr:proteasome assembly chaperone family protein [Candidatus Micrarchaeota archaeon]